MNTDATHLTSKGTLLWVNRAGLVIAEQPPGKGKLFYFHGEEPRIEEFDLVPF